MGETLRQNIQRMGERRRLEAERESVGEKIARTITRFTGSMAFVYLHLIAYGLWIVINIGWVPVDQAVRSHLRDPGVRGVGGGDLPLHLRADQPEPHGGRRRQARRPRSPHRPADRA
jgi:hypothetical protein